MSWKVELDRAGIGAILRSPEAAKLANEAAAKVAANIRGDTEIEPYTTDRAAAAVVHKDRDAAGQQAKHGTLTAAAAAAGMPVSGSR